jgi:hypothetical protein
MLHFTEIFAKLPVRTVAKDCEVPAATVTVSGLTPMEPAEGVVVRQPGKLALKTIKDR